MEALDRASVEHLICLKVCELCGRLFGQSAGGTPYCAACEREFREFPPVGSRRLRGRPPCAKLAEVPDED